MKVKNTIFSVMSAFVLVMASASTLTFASETQFSLSNADKTLVGQGTYQVTEDDQAQITIRFQDFSYTGTGLLKGAGHTKQQLQKLGIRSDRALLKSLSLRHKKSIESLLTAENGDTLNCELNVSGSHIDGQCEDAKKQRLEVKDAADIAS